MTRSALDLAHAAMQAGDEAEARAFYRLLADAPLCLLLSAPAEGDQLQPQVFDLSDGPVILAFDSEERLAAFQDGPQPYAVLPGRVIAQAVAGQGVSLGLNLGTGAESETLLPPEVLTHLLALLDVSSDVLVGQARRFEPPQVPTAAQAALAAAVQSAAGLVVGAVLAAVTYDTGARGHILALIGANPAAEPALAQAMAEALSFAGLEAAALDVVFLSAEAPALRRIAAVGHAFEIIQPMIPDAPVSAPAPGSDPDRPPRLR
ncbi:MAG: SseB family protein [Paracoccaceae bacterium]